jgi:hypothetical protein
MMNVRTVRAGGVVTMLVASVIGLPGRDSPVEASSRVIHATGTLTLLGADSFELVPRQHQCLLRLHQTVAVAGTLEGADSVEAQIRWFATCDEVFATNGAGIVSTYNAVGHYVGVDGKEATLRDVSRTDAAGDAEGIITVQGDLNGILRETATTPPPGGTLVSTYDGFLVEKG